MVLLGKEESKPEKKLNKRKVLNEIEKELKNREKR